MVLCSSPSPNVVHDFVTALSVSAVPVCKKGHRPPCKPVNLTMPIINFQAFVEDLEEA